MTDHVSVAGVKAELVERMRSKDLAGTLELIADDAVYFWSDGASMFGKEAVAEGLASNFAGIGDDTYDVDDVTWLVESGDAAACVFRFTWTGVVDGRPVGGWGRGASFFRRGGPLGWQVVHENLSRGAWK